MWTRISKEEKLSRAADDTIRAYLFFSPCSAFSVISFRKAVIFVTLVQITEKVNRPRFETILHIVTVFIRSRLFARFWGQDASVNYFGVSSNKMTYASPTQTQWSNVANFLTAVNKWFWTTRQFTTIYKMTTTVSMLCLYSVFTADCSWAGFTFFFTFITLILTPYLTTRNQKFSTDSVLTWLIE